MFIAKSTMAAALALVLTIGASALSNDDKPQATPGATVVVPFYGNALCPVSGRAIDADVFVEFEGQRAYYCCTDCQGKAATDPKAAIAAAYTKVVRHANKVCPVSGEDIDPESATAVAFQGHEFQLCCEKCEAGAMKNPALYVSMVLHPEAAYAGAMCPLTGRDAAKGPHVLYKNHLVSLCCKKCLAKVKEAPEESLAKILN